MLLIKKQMRMRAKRASEFRFRWKHSNLINFYFINLIFFDFIKRKTNEDVSEASIRIPLSLDTFDYFWLLIYFINLNFWLLLSENKWGCEQSEHPSSLCFGNIRIFSIFSLSSETHESLKQISIIIFYNSLMIELWVI